MNAFHFGQRMRIKLAAGPGLPAPTSSLTGTPTLPTQPPQGSTMSLARSGAPKPQTGVSGSGMQFGGPQQTPQTQQSSLPKDPSTTWGGYLTGKNGLRKDVGDYFTHTLPETFNPWSEAYQTADARYKNMPTERLLRRGAQASAVTAAVAGIAAGGLAAAPALGIGAGGGGTTAATAGTGAAAATQTPAGQQFMNRAGQFATQAQQTLGNLSANYFTRVEPTLNRIGYKPEEVITDGAALLTGNFDKIKGPGWGFKTPSLPQGAPSLPRPLEAWRNYYGADPSAPAGVARAGM